METKTFAEYTVNKLYDKNFFSAELPSILLESGMKEESLACFTFAKDFLSNNKLKNLKEAHLEKAFIIPIFEKLGWGTLYQETKVIQGKQIRPDWTLFASQTEQEEHCHTSPEDRKANMQGIVAFLESKAADKKLDTGKAERKENPFLQLLEYLTLTRIPTGFLSNGREFWIVDNSTISSEKRYLSVDLESILEDDNTDAFYCFYCLFHRSMYVASEGEKVPSFEELRIRDTSIRTASEDTLRRVIYGADGNESLFETIGKALFKHVDNKEDTQSLRDVYRNSLYFLFRLLFIAYFEDRHWDTLTKHSFYINLSLRSIKDKLSHKQNPKAFTAWNDLQVLFETLDSGNLNLSIPLLNGGLFDKAKAPLLAKARVINNEDLEEIFAALFSFERGSNFLERDFKTLSVQQLGTIYESLLEFEFRVAQEDLVYVTYKKDKETIEGYFDTYDTTTLKTDKKTQVLTEKPFPKHTLYLVGSQNSRKASASFYTPSSLSFPLVKRAIDQQLANMDVEKSVLDLRILDNACGSGHMLIESLNYLSTCALDRMESDPLLEITLRDEMERIQNTLRELDLPDALDPDEFMVLKRILLKKVIYGVDLQPFAVELAHLALWIETFIFGTPLSLIEHHIKVGNALIGTNRKAFDDALGKAGHANLFEEDITANFRTLSSVYSKLSNIQDTTAADITRSKRIFTEEIRPTLAKLNCMLNMCNYRDMLIAEGKGKDAKLLEVGIKAQELLDGKNPELAATLAQYCRTYRFFNWEIEFPEAFKKDDYGFHIIVGNPPWDKTKFEDPMFFSQYRSNYRTLKNSEKKSVASDLLSKPDVKARYDAQETTTKAINEYYKALYPLNAGAGDGNLFRFFVERNLSILAKKGSLNYVLPTAFMTDEGSINLRKAIFEKYTLASFDGFENNRGIFPDVHRSYKFGLLQIIRQKNAEQVAKMRFMLTDPAILHSNEGIFNYPLSDVLTTSPNHYAYMEVAHGRDDLELVKRFYEKFSPLSEQWIDFRTELHATGDKSIFLETYQKGYLPLYKGASIWQYNSVFDDAEYWLDPQQFDAHLHNKETSRLIDDIYPSLIPQKGMTKEKTVLKALGLEKKEELAQFVAPDRQFFRLGYRVIARDTDERSLIITLLPKNIGAQHSMFLTIPKTYAFDTKSKKIVPKQVPVIRLLFIQALFNSIIVDWVLRFSIAINVTKTFLMRQPMPQPSDAEIEASPIYTELVRNSLCLSLAYNKKAFAELQASFAIKDSEIPTTDKAQDMLKIRNDILVAGLYGVNKSDMEHIVKSFKVLLRKRPQYVAMLLAQMK